MDSTIVPYMNPYNLRDRTKKDSIRHQIDNNYMVFLHLGFLDWSLEFLTDQPDPPFSILQWNGRLLEDSRVYDLLPNRFDYIHRMRLPHQYDLENRIAD